MRIFGIDFTARPSTRKPLTCFSAQFDADVLWVGAEASQRWSSFQEFEQALRHPGPWIAGIDFPFGQSRKLVENLDWPRGWAKYVSRAGSLSSSEFYAELKCYQDGRPYHDKEHKRATDIEMGAISPQKLHFVPVARMFYQGAPRLICSGVTIPMLQAGDPQRLVVEAYPGVLARFLIGRESYKTDNRKKQTETQRQQRCLMLSKILDGEIETRYGFRVAPEADLGYLVDDPSGDQLDALLCTIQAAWAWKMRGENYGAPAGADVALEGWIADPGGSVAERKSLSPG